MTISSTSTLSEVLAEYNDSLSWEGNVTLAKQNLAAVRWLMVNRPSDTDIKGQVFRFDYSSLQKQEVRLMAFIDSASSVSSSGKSMFTRAKL